MNYKVYFRNNKCNTWYKYDKCLFNMNSFTPVNLAEYIINMPEPTVSVYGNIVTMTFQPIPTNIAQQFVDDNKLRFQVVRHKANSSHTQSIDFPYSFQYEKAYLNGSGIQNEKYGVSLPNNGSAAGVNLGIVTSPTLSELTSGVIIRDMSNLFNNINLHKCQMFTETSPFVAEFYFGFIYWRRFDLSPDIFKMGYYSREAEN